MADTIAVMSRGRIEQLGTPEELYERPRTQFVAQFLGVSNLLRGEVAERGVVVLGDGTRVRASVNGHAGRVAIGVRPEKIRIGVGDAAGAGDNVLAGKVAETAYVGVSTQLVVGTAVGDLTVYVQNSGGRAAPQPGDAVSLAWDADSTFVLDPPQEETE